MWSADSFHNTNNLDQIKVTAYTCTYMNQPRCPAKFSAYVNVTFVRSLRTRKIRPGDKAIYECANFYAAVLIGRELCIHIYIIHDQYSVIYNTLARFPYNKIYAHSIINNHVYDSDGVALVSSLFTGFVNDLLKIEYVQSSGLQGSHNAGDVLSSS